MDTSPRDELLPNDSSRASSSLKKAPSSFSSAGNPSPPFVNSALHSSIQISSNLPTSTIAASSSCSSMITLPAVTRSPASPSKLNNTRWRNERTRACINSTCRTGNSLVLLSPLALRNVPTGDHAYQSCRSAALSTDWIPIASPICASTRSRPAGVFHTSYLFSTSAPVRHLSSSGVILSLSYGNSCPAHALIPAQINAQSASSPAPTSTSKRNSMRS